MTDPPGRVLRVRGTGRVDVPAYGVADAEHLVETEIRRAWPEARVEILEISRSEGVGRIVEDFTVSYRIRAELPVEDGVDATSHAFRAARARLRATRFGKTRWEREG